MASVGGLSAGASSGLNMYGASMKGYGGLASGMDTEGMIESMTAGTRTKIAEALKKKEKYQWQMDAYRSVSDMLVSFSKKFLNITDSNSPYRASFYDKTLATVGGANSKFVSVTGPGSMLERMKILGVSSLAKDATRITNNQISDRDFSTGKINYEDLVQSNLEGGSIKLKVGDKNITLTMASGEKLKDANGNEFKADYTTTDGTVKAINAKLGAIKLDATTNLSDKLKMEYSGNKFSLVATEDDLITITGGSAAQLKTMGFLDDDGKVLGDGRVGTGGYTGHKEVTDAEVEKRTPFAKHMADRTMTFSFNGSQKTIKLPSEDEWKAIMEKNGSPTSEAERSSALASYMQGKLNAAYGSNKIQVDGSDPTKGLTFNTVDNSSVLKITDADAYVIGEEGLMDINYGTGNRLNLNATLEESGLASALGANWKNDNGELYIEINGKEIKDLTDKSTVGEIINAINRSDAGVKVSYLETADTFSLTSTIKGEAGAIDFKTADNGTTSNLASALFANSTFNAGKDAEMEVEYEGGVTMTIKRDSNNFNLDGTTFTLNGLFDSNGVEADKVSFSTSVDTDKVTKTIGSMIEEYNKIIETVQNLVGQKPDRDYGPLTDDEKSQLSESQITKLENKAKEGILFNDPLLRSLSDKLRTVFTGNSDLGTLKEMGITVGSSYKDGGKINFDETKFKAALQEDPEKVKTLFTKPSTDDYAGGFAVRLKGIAETFAKTEGATKGLLIEKAGSNSAATSLSQNALQKLMDQIDTDVKSLKKKLQTEIDRYSRQFTSLEQLVSQMNSQSSWLSQAMGG